MSHPNAVVVDDTGRHVTERGHVRAPMTVRPGLTLVFGAALATTALSSSALNVMGGVDLVTHLLCSVPALYFLCICVHDGVHGVLARRRWVNQSVAALYALVIGLPFPLLQSAHLTHHRALRPHRGVDDGGRRDDDNPDPEAIVYSAAWWQLPFRLPLVPFYYLRSVVDLNAMARLLTVLHFAIIAAAFALTGEALIEAWLLPTLIAVVWFGFTTVYVPHSRYAAVLMPWLQAHSGWHFDHHQDARYPFSQYAQLRFWHIRMGISETTAREARAMEFLARELW